MAPNTLAERSVRVMALRLVLPELPAPTRLLCIFLWLRVSHDSQHRLLVRGMLKAGGRRGSWRGGQSALRFVHSPLQENGRVLSGGMEMEERRVQVSV